MLDKTSSISQQIIQSRADLPRLLAPRSHNKQTEDAAEGGCGVGWAYNEALDNAITRANACAMRRRVAVPMFRCIGREDSPRRRCPGS